MKNIVRWLVVLVVCGSAQADVIMDWNARVDAIATDRKLASPAHGRALVMMHVAMFEALNAIDRRYQPYRLNLVADRNTSREVAAATAGHDVLLALYPDQKASLDELLEQTLAAVPDGPPRERALILGRKAAAGILELRNGDGAGAADTYRPVTPPGQYVPTAAVANAGVGAWTPWVMTAATSSARRRHPRSRPRCGRAISTRFATSAGSTAACAARTKLPSPDSGSSPGRGPGIPWWRS